MFPDEIDDEENDDSELEPTAMIPSGRPNPAKDEPLPDFLVASLEIVDGKEKGKKWVLDRSSTTIGRSKHCDVHIHDDAASRLHASITYVDHEFRLNDTSSNGTLLNGSRVTGYAVHDGDKIRIGETMFLFRRKQK